MAVKAEDLGYSTFHLADHYLGPGAAATTSGHRVQTVAAVPAMMAASCATSTISIGCRVLCVDYHQPAVLAKELATIEWLSGGRLEPGFGAAGSKPNMRRSVCRWIAPPFESLGWPRWSLWLAMPFQEMSLITPSVSTKLAGCRPFQGRLDLMGHRS